MEDGSDFYLGLLAYRSTLLECGKSPSEFPEHLVSPSILRRSMFVLYILSNCQNSSDEYCYMDVGTFAFALLNNGRKIRSNLPISESQLKLKSYENGRKYFSEQKVKQKLYFDKKTRNLPALKVGESMRIRSSDDKIWSRKGVIKVESSPRSYVVESEEGVRYRRNRQDILKSSELSSEVDESSNRNEIETSSSDAESMEQLPDIGEPRRSERLTRRPNRLIEEI